MKFALAGNPNCGKTTLFNALTGSKAHVGNFPGVTVEKREGIYKTADKSEQHTIMDLPGLYSMSPYSPEEIVARTTLIGGEVDAIINIVDATSLERGLYLTTQLLELDIPLVIALNMMDVIEKSGGVIDIPSLEKALGVPVIPVSALKKKGRAELMDAAAKAALIKRQGVGLAYCTGAGEQILNAAKALRNQQVDNSVFLAVKLLEGDELIADEFSALAKIVQDTLKGTAKTKTAGKEKPIDFEAVIADLRYKFICDKVVPYALKVRADSMSRSKKIDRVLTNRYAAIPIFLAIMFAVFHLTFSGDLFFLSAMGASFSIPSPGVFLQEALGSLMGLIMEGVAGLLENAPAWFGGLIVDGLLAGLDAVLSFLPQILLLFLFLSILEDSGYMARVAFIMDRAFRRFGLSGRAFMPLLMCFGCAVPGIMATRTLSTERERKLSIFLSPFFSCGAKLPIWATVASVVFSSSPDVAVFGIYFLGIAVAILSAILLGKTVLKGETPPFIMEMPAYRMPTLTNTFRELWKKLKHYLFRAATVIAGAIIVIWFLSNFSFTFQMTEPSADNSILGVLGRFFAPVFVPLGFGAGDDGWKFVVAIFTGLIAKEMVVATLGALSGVGGALDMETGEIAGTSLGLLISGLTGPAAFAFMAFNLLSVPCMAAVAAARAELKSKKHLAMAIIYWLLTAYIVALLVNQIGTLFITQSTGGIIAAIAVIGFVIFTIIFNITRKKRLKRLGLPPCGGSCGSCNGCGDVKTK